MAKNASRMFLSIDFEDFAFDKRRDLGLNAGNDIRSDALHRALDRIQLFAESSLSDPRMTFFCTGVVAQKCPDVVRRIADLGHEVACHYFYETLVHYDPPDVFAQHLQNAQKVLQDASGQAVRGFRAPQFSLRADDREKYAFVENFFDYDSSMVVDTLQEQREKTDQLGLTRLRIFPVGRHKIYRLMKPMRSGGTYFKLFPSSFALDLLRRSVQNDLAPMLYLHPHEMVGDGSFMLRWKDLEGLPLLRRAYIRARQVQWHVIGNQGVEAKLRKVLGEFDHGGLMCELLATDYGKPSGATAVCS